MSGRYNNYHNRPPPHPHYYHRGDGRPGGGRGYYGGGRGYDRPHHGGGGYRGGPPPNRGRPPPRTNKPLPITFRSFEEEQQWLSDRRQRRLQRTTKFDIRGESTTDEVMGMTSLNGQHQTRHARRLYVGNLPTGVTETDIHDAFRKAIRETIEDKGYDDGDDPILTVYINHERRFSFIEFKTVEICSACMDLDGLEIQPGYPVKVKRPNDYNPALAPAVSEVPTLDVSKIGIISPTVLDGPNKIFIGGLHYYFTEPQVLELLRAFGKVKAFHLVKNDPESTTSKGYCFVEYLDPEVTPVAVQGLNGMDIGDGKSLTARVAGGVPSSDGASVPTEDQPPVDATVVDGYDIESLVDAAMGRRPMPHGPVYVDGTTGTPITRIRKEDAVPIPASEAPSSSASSPTRVLVLLNMVTMDDMATEEAHSDLIEEVQGECSKFGTIQRIIIPRMSTDHMAPSAVKKIFIQYETVSQAMAAQDALSGRQFADSIVATEYYSEQDFSVGKLA